MNNCSELGLSADMQEVIRKLGYTALTDIQERSIPLIIDGKDVIGESATGSGKTLAFGSPLIDKINPKMGIQVLVLTPTRELAEQVKKDLTGISYSKKIRITSVYGGVSINNQIKLLKKSEVVIATPGRLLDHIDRKTIDLSWLNTLVLDEADRMLDMGFIGDVEKIIKFCPKKRQTLFFSATISKAILRLTKKHMNDPHLIKAEKMVDPEKLEQFYYNVKKHDKLSLLTHLLKKDPSRLSMVFCNTRKMTDFVSDNLTNQGSYAITIHGGFTQSQRNNAIARFNNSRSSVLVCTDIAARGLHIENVSHVFNYDLPAVPNDYIHRIGRTARAGECGKVINLVTDFNRDYFSRILKKYPTFSIEKVIPPKFKKLKVARKGRSGSNKGRLGSNSEGNRNDFFRNKNRKEKGSKRGFGQKRNFEKASSKNNQERFGKKPLGKNKKKFEPAKDKKYFSRTAKPKNAHDNSNSKNTPSNNNNNNKPNRNNRNRKKRNGNKKYYGPSKKQNWKAKKKRNVRPLTNRSSRDR